MYHPHSQNVTTGPLHINQIAITMCIILHWDSEKDNHGPMTELNTNTSAYLTEAIHITVCNQYKTKYIKLLERIETIKQNITYKIEKVMPRLMPNENAIIYGKETQTDTVRKKRAIILGLIFSGVSAIGGLIMKGVNTWSNYKKSKAMTKAVEKLYEAQEN